jgi:ADP-ribosylglycohydrolase
MTVTRQVPGGLSRYQGALLGLAAGDALGTTLEFTNRAHVKPIAEMVGGGPFGLAPGEWTDDTSMAMCLAESLVECGFDARDQMQRYVRWSKDGYWSSNGRCFDIGATVAAALRRFETTGNPMAGSTDPYSAGNGSLMRFAPVPLRFAFDAALAVRLAGESSRTTHGAAEAVDACRYFAALILGALDGRSKEDLLSPSFVPPALDWMAEPLAPAIAAVASGSFKSKTRELISASGYVVHTLEAALWAFHHSSDFREGALLAVNLGEDADTTGAVYGQLAGAYYGVQGIPSEWRQLVVRAPEITTLANALFAACADDRKNHMQVARDVATRLGRDAVGIGDAGRYVAASGTPVDIRAAVEAATNATIEYPPDRHPSWTHAAPAEAKISVENATVLAVGRRMHRAGPVAALNFASAECPGGGFLTGARAQEESIARRCFATTPAHCWMNRGRFRSSRLRQSTGRGCNATSPSA